MMAEMSFLAVLAVSSVVELIGHVELKSEHVGFANVLSWSHCVISFDVLVLVHGHPKPAEQVPTIRSPDLRVPA